MSHENITALLKDLGEELGIEDLALEADHCRLQSDGDLTVDLDYIGEGDLLILSCPLGPLEAARRGEVMAALLAANCFWQGTGGPTLSLDEAGEGLLQRQVQIDGLEFPSFYKALEDFALCGEQWIKRLRELNQGIEEDPETAPLPGVGMIRG